MQRPPLIVLAAGAMLAAFVLFAALAPKTSASASDPAVNVEAERARMESVSAREAEAWAEARAADTDAGYRVYLAAFPNGAFAEEANQELGHSAAPREIASHTPAVSAPRGPSRAEIASSCHAWVDANWPAPSRVARIGGGAAGGCAIGALAGGDDRRNCAIGAVAGGVTGEVTARRRESRRETEYQTCVSQGGPP